MRAFASYRLGLSLALFALWLLVAGPLLSQALMPRDAGHESHAAHHGSHHGMPDAQSAHSPHHSAHLSATPSQPAEALTGEALWSACGYCTLLFSSPAIETPSLWVGLPHPPHPRPSAERRQGFPTVPATRGPRPRAPPLPPV